MGQFTRNVIFQINFCVSAIMLCACSASKTETASQSYSQPDYATAEIDLSTPQGSAYAMMMAMYRGDAEMVDKIFAEGGRLSRVKADGSVEPNGLKRWRDWVGTLKPGQANEELFGLQVQQFGKLATVWAPFVIRFDGKIVGCGVNQFSMAQIKGEWRIVSGIDTPAPKTSCENFKSAYLAEENI